MNSSSRIQPRASRPRVTEFRIRERVGVGYLILALLLLVLPMRAAAQEQIGPDTPLPLDPRLTHGVLDNGLRYYIRENRRPENRAELRLVVNTGSVLEDDDQLGLAHFVEHMAFNGTRRFPRQELV